MEEGWFAAAVCWVCLFSATKIDRSEYVGWQRVNFNYSAHISRPI